MARDIAATTINAFFYLLYILIVVRVVLSWFQITRRNVLIDLVYALTEPILVPVRALLRKSPLGGSGSMIDLSPLVLILIIMLVRNILLGFTV